jgi:hypothetical protein
MHVGNGSWIDTFQTGEGGKVIQRTRNVHRGIEATDSFPRLASIVGHFDAMGKLYNTLFSLPRIPRFPDV